MVGYKYLPVSSIFNQVLVKSSNGSVTVKLQFFYKKKHNQSCKVFHNTLHTFSFIAKDKRLLHLAGSKQRSKFTTIGKCVNNVQFF